MILAAHQTLLSVYRAQIYLVAVCTSEAPPILVFEFLQRVYDTLMLYFSPAQISEHLLKENLVLVYEASPCPFPPPPLDSFCRPFDLALHSLRLSAFFYFSLCASACTHPHFASYENLIRCFRTFIFSHSLHLQSLLRSFRPTYFSHTDHIVYFIFSIRKVSLECPFLASFSFFLYFTSS